MGAKINGVGGVLFAGLLLVLSSAVAWGGGNVIKVGRWTVREDSFYIFFKYPVWTGRASAGAGDDRFTCIEIFANGKEVSIPEAAHRLTLPGAGTVFFKVAAGETAGPGQPPPFGVFSIKREFFWLNEGQCIVVRSVERAQLVPSSQEWEGWIEANRLSAAEKESIMAHKVAESVRTAADGPEMNLLGLMLEGNVELGQYEMAKGLPKVEASIEGGEFHQLKHLGVLKGGRCGWKLPARPGQEIAFRVQLCGVHYVVSARGIKTIEDNGVLQGLLVGIREYPPGDMRSKDPEDRWIEGEVDSAGLATVEYGDLKSPLLLQLHFGDWHREGGEFYGHIFLRWGRAREKWGTYFPLAEKPEKASVEDCVRCILADMESAKDADRDEFFVRRGDTRACVPGFYALASLEGLELEDYAGLSSLISDLSMKQRNREALRGELWQLAQSEALDGLTEDEVAAKTLGRVCGGNYGARLWEDLECVGIPKSPSGWHNPRAVYELAVLWQHFTELRERNPLERVLDYWVEAIGKRSVPVERYGKVGTHEDQELISRGYAIGALHIGYEVFGKPEYAASRDKLLESMRTVGKGQECYKAMVAKSGLYIGRDLCRGDSCWPAVCNFVSIYGQSCAFIGNDEELAKSQNWIISALMREGQKGANAFGNYENATFGQRCGMIAVLRGRASYLGVPEREE